MEQKINDYAALVLLFAPAFSAGLKLFTCFNIIDLIYLILAGILFLGYFIKKKIQTKE